MSDLISREEAIKTLRELWRETNDIWYEEVYNMAIEALQAEPKTGELVRCKDCDWWEKSDDSLQGRCERYGFYPTGEYYCAGAVPKGHHDYERATDQASHDMRYEPTFNPDDGNM